MSTKIDVTTQAPSVSIGPEEVKNVAQWWLNRKLRNNNLVHLAGLDGLGKVDDSRKSLDRIRTETDQIAQIVKTRIQLDTSIPYVQTQAVTTAKVRNSFENSDDLFVFWGACETLGVNTPSGFTADRMYSEVDLCRHIDAGALWQGSMTQSFNQQSVEDLEKQFWSLASHAGVESMSMEGLVVAYCFRIHGRRTPYSVPWELLTEIVENQIPIPKVAASRLDIASTFSTAGWSHRPLRLASINVNRFGGPVVVYACRWKQPTGNDQIEADVNPFSDLDNISCSNLSDHPRLFTTPEWLSDHGIPVTRGVYQEGDVWITAPGAVTMTLRLGFGCTETQLLTLPGWEEEAAFNAKPCPHLYNRPELDDLVHVCRLFGAVFEKWPEYEEDALLEDAPTEMGGQ